MSPVLLDHYAAIRCPVKVHNGYDPAFASMQIGTSNAPIVDEHEWQRHFTFMNSTLGQFAHLPGAVDLREIKGYDESVQATREAYDKGVPVIVAPTVPIDVEGHRCGSPKMLLRGADRADGTPGYLPVYVRSKKMLERTPGNRTVMASLAKHPGPHHALPVKNARRRSGRDDELLMLAHFWRMLEAAGWQAPGDPCGGIVGTDMLSYTNTEHGDLALKLVSGSAIHDESNLVVAWTNLLDKTIRTYSRTSSHKWKMRSPLERYDHEFTFRLKVATQAAERSTEDESRPPMVSPIVSSECEMCPWWTVCEPQLDKDDISLRISKSRLDVKEIATLRAMDIRRVADLVNANIAELMKDYLPHVGHRPAADHRLEVAVRRARLLSEGVEIEKISNKPLDLPEPGFEIDWDIETSASNQVYLWGFWVSDARKPDEPGYYRHFSRFEDLNDAEEFQLAAEAVTWLLEMCAEHPDTRIYHYSDYEMVRLQKLASASHYPILEKAHEELRSRTVDLFAVVRAHYFGVHGLGLKTVATGTCGFHWRDEDPGGLNSQTWFHDAVHAPTPEERAQARQRVLEYNEDDTKATKALRTWLRAQEA